MSMRQLTTEVRNRLQLTTEVPMAVNCRQKKKKKTSALKCGRTHQIFLKKYYTMLCHVHLLCIALFVNDLEYWLVKKNTPLKPTFSPL